MYEYKVLTDRDARFSGKFDLDALEATLNSYAAVKPASRVVLAVSIVGSGWAAAVMRCPTVVTASLSSG